MPGITFTGNQIKSATAEQLFEHDILGLNSLQYAILDMRVHDALNIIRKEGVTPQMLLGGDQQGDNSLDYAAKKLKFVMDDTVKNQPVDADIEKIMLAIGRITGMWPFNKYMPGEIMHDKNVVKVASKLKKEISRSNLSGLQGEDAPDLKGGKQSLEPLKKSGRGNLRLVE